jgi:serine/threonine protein kinase
MKDLDPQSVYESLQTDLRDIYSMAVNREDILSEDFSATLFNEIRDLEQRYGDKIHLDEGGMKKIFKTEDKTTGRYVAMAFLKDNKPRQRERFLREARLTATLEHPNIMPIYDIGIADNNEPFFTMKLTGGKSLNILLKEKFKSGSQWPLFQRLSLFLNICEGLSYAHSRNVLHLDIKPQNILVGEFGEVIICDWGLGKILFDAEVEEDVEEIDPAFFNEMTMDGVVKGTPGYMAPEQIDKKSAKRDKRTDVYALGGILYSLLTGKAPVQGKELEEIFKNTLSGKIASPKSLAKEIPLALEAVAMKALAVSQAERYQTIEEIRTDIEAYMGGFATQAENAGFFRNTLLLLSRHKTKSFFIILIIALCSIFITELVQREREARELLSLYEAAKKRTELLGKDATPHLVTQSWRYLYAYDYGNCRHYAERAVSADSNNKEAWEIKAMLHFYSQEFRSAVAAFKKAPNNKSVQRFMELAKEYSKVKGDRGRLAPTKFIELLNKIPTLDNKRTFYRNEVANYRSVPEHMINIKAMLKVNNPELKVINLNYQLVKGKNILDLTGNPNMEQVGCIRKMPLHKLNLEDLPLINKETAQFRGMPLEELNLAGTKISDFKFLQSTPNLKKLIISKGQMKSSLLKKWSKQIKIVIK